MIEEQGTVIDRKDDRVIIRVPRSSACESCASKAICHSTSETDMVIEADDPVGAKVGDRVVFTVGAADIIKAGVLFYLIPLLAFIAGVVIGQVLPGLFSLRVNADMLSTLFGFVFVVLAFLGLRIYGRMAEKTRPMRPRVLRVV